MSDGYMAFANTGPGGWLASTFGLPRPAELRRRADSGAALPGPILLHPAKGGRMAAVLASLGVVESGADPKGRVAALVFDASDCLDAEAARSLHGFFQSHIRQVTDSGRIVVIGLPPDEAADLEGAAIQRGLEGFVRSIAKEAGRGVTAQLIRVERGAEDAARSTLAFFLSPRSAYVSGQVVSVMGSSSAAAPGHQGRRVLVTGASRGIGEAIARLFAGQGAHVVALDTPGAADPLKALAQEIGARAMTLDITAPGAAQILLRAAETDGVYDVVVHNAGVTRDKTIARMDPAWWDMVMAVNLTAPLRITQALLDGGAISDSGRVVAVSSLSGIAGNRGQTNYALSKAGWIGAVARLGREAAGTGRTINAVAPGFIETAMTAAIPFTIREAGRRMNSLSQGGAPLDVAETIAWLAEPESGGVNGQVIRVCGQSLLGA